MYSREVDGSVATFGVSGKLWHGVLVMFDRETSSLWTQLDGRAIEGPHAGTMLEHRDSTYTTWEHWVAEHPDTLVLSKTAEERDAPGSHYEDYFADPDRLYFPHLAEGLGGVGPKDVVYGIVIGDAALAVTESLLARHGFCAAVVGGRPVAFLRSESTERVVAVERVDGDRILALARDPDADPTLAMRDARSAATIDVSTLPPVRVDRAYWYAWARSHPGSQVLAD